MAPNLHQAFARARTSFMAALPEHRALDVRLTYSKTPEFIAQIKRTDTRVVVTLSKGVIKTFDDIWSQTIVAAKEIETNVHPLAALGVPALSSLSLEWLCLHELMHLRFGHLVGDREQQLVDISPVRPDLPKGLKAALPDIAPHLIRKCFEMQADDEATELFLGTYAVERHKHFRYQNAAIVAAMLAIDMHSPPAQGNNNTHPLPQTRFFMLLARLMQMWRFTDAYLEPGKLGSIIRNRNMPDDAARRTYQAEIIAPLIADALQISVATGAQEIQAMLLDADGFFADIDRAQFAKNPSESDFETAAGREWRRLLPINERILSYLGFR